MVLIQGFRTGGRDESGPVLADGAAILEDRTASAGTRGKARVDDRRIISGIVHVLKSGGRWIDAPPEYGPMKTLYNRYVRWAAKGIWVGLFQALAQADGPPDQVLLDSSAVKAHRSAAGGKGGEKSSHRPLARRALDENSRADRHSMPTARLHADWRASRRLHSRRSVA
jgi:transposase